MIYRTAYDPEMSAEGALDPLGLYSIADLLANRMLPGIRERHSRPRFLTFIAVGLLFMDRVEQVLPVDEWQVDFWEAFEWNIVSAVVATAKGPIAGMPGQEKARYAMKRDIPLNRDRYLKQSSVFGFHGVYKLLTRTLQIETENGFSIPGEKLAHIWVKEEGVNGFVPGSHGQYERERERFVKTLTESLREGMAKEKWNSTLYPFLAQHFDHSLIMSEERSFISQLLRGDTRGYRSEVIDYLRSKEAQKLIRSFKGDWSERDFYSLLLSKSSSRLKNLIKAILAYEAFARLITDAFYDILYQFSLSGRAVRIAELATLEEIKKINEKTVKAYRLVDNALAQVGDMGISTSFSNKFSAFSVPYSPEDWVRELMKHHIENQRKKPPKGKRPWFDVDDEGRYWGRPDYARNEGGLHNDAFVHFYRLRTLQSFLTDLKEI